MQDFYKILGLDASATNEEIDLAYNELRKKYQEERFCDGEKGNEAAKNLTKLETAYYEIKEARKNTTMSNNYFEYDFSGIERLIKSGNISAAQSALDDCNERNAEWHYLQSVVFYKKNWMSESKKQLEIAIEMDPSNQKYRSAYGKMNARNEQQQQYQQTQNPYSRGGASYDQPEQMGGTHACSDCVSCCYTYLCIDCLFSLCCGCR